MRIKKILSVLLTLCLFVNVSFAFDPYADEEVEKKSYKKLYYGIALTLLGGFLAYDGFSLEKVDVSKPSVDYTTVLHSEWTQVTELGQSSNDKYEYKIKSGWTEDIYREYEIEDVVYNLCTETTEYNRIYNNGNVDLNNITIEVRYRNHGGNIIVCDDPDIQKHNGEDTTDGYHKVIYQGKISLAKGESFSWKDVWGYSTIATNGEVDPNSTPAGDDRVQYIEGRNPGTEGLNLGEKALILMDVRVILEKNQQYTPIYETRHKNDLEGVAGVFVGIAGIYFIIDHFFDMHKFNAYAKRHHLNLRVATASNQYKLMLQKRI